jgi:glutamine synthetase
MLRICVASAGNDHRLGANEAPPAVVSVFIGTELSAILSAIENDEPYGSKEKELIKVGVHVLPKFPRDTTDRNRTSPFAFTGNKFEFRMVGSSQSISGPNVVLNTAVAESLRQYADALEGAEDFEKALHDLIRDVIRKHKRIIFNGNGYDDAWLREAESRGLLNLRSTPDCVPYYLAPKNIELFARHKVYSEAEIRARYEIKLDGYCKVLHIEALTMLDMVWKDILPAVSMYSKALADAAMSKKALCGEIDCRFETEQAKKISRLTAAAVARAQDLEYAVQDAKNAGDSLAQARCCRDEIYSAMNELRSVIDELESSTASSFWPYPSYGELLFSVR